MGLMFYIFADGVNGKNIGIGSYTVVVFTSGAIVAVAATWFIYKFKALTNGDRSFRYLVVLFSKLLKYAAPFDPYRNKPICTHAKPSI